MKRFLSIILTAAMLMSATPAVFAENNAVDESVIVAEELTPENQEEITEEVTDNVTEDVSEEISGEGEENSEEQISLMSGENDVSLLANETNEVQYSTDGGSTWTSSTFDNIWSEAEKIANKGKSYQIKVSKDFSLTENKEYSLSYGVKVTIYADADVTITVPTSTKIIVKSGGQYNGGDAILTFGKSGAAGTVTFDGKNEMFSEAAFRAEWSSGSYMGHLVINDGVSIKNFKRTKGGTYYGIIYNNGQLDINGGSITNNEISSNTVDSVIFNCRKLNITGGEISNNSITSYYGYIVMVRGSSAEFTMTGGKIVSNNVRKTVIQLAQDDSSYQGSATITKGTIANNKGYSYSDDNFTADARDISIGASLTKLTLNGTAEIGTIETNVKNINNSKFITIASGFAPVTPISVLVSMSYIGGQVYPSEGMQVATVEDGASINGMLVYYNTDFSISDDGKLAGPPEVEYSTDSGATWTSSSLSDAVTAIGADTGTIKVLRDITTSAEIEITGTVTIDLDGHYISGNNDHRIFSSTGTFTLKDTSEAKTGTLKDGYVEVSGGYYGQALGAAVYAEQNSIAVIENVIFDNNKVFSSNGFSMIVFGGAVFSENATTTISNSTFKNNVATAGGGAVGVNGGSATINNSTFSNNYVDLYNCSYAGGGGAVWSETSDLVSINGCVFENNVLKDDNIKPTTEDSYPNPAWGGGAIEVSQCTKIIISNCSFTKNSAKTKEFGGGAICNYASEVEINNCRIFENTSNQYGGGIYLTDQGVGTQTTVKDSYIANNTADTAGDDIASKVKTAQRFGATYNGNYKDSEDVEYKVQYFYDGYKNGEILENRYDQTTAEEKTDIANTNEACGLKTVYTEKASTYAVTVTDPIYMAATYPGGTDSKIGTITVTGASDLAAVPEGTELTLAITVADDTKAKNHTFVKWVVKTAGGEDVTVTDNKFTMPSEAVTVTAEYVPDIQMTFYAGGASADSSNECKDYVWNENGSITYTMPDNKGTLTISTPNGFKLWQYIVDDETKTPTVTANDVVTVTVNTDEGYTFNGIKRVTSQMGNLNGTFNNSGTYTFSVPVGTFNNYKGTQNAYIILDITTNQYNITKNYNTNEGEVIVIDRFDSTHTSIDKAYYKENLWVSIEPKANYKIKSVSCKVGENNVSDFAQASTTGKSYTFTMPASDVTINVEFELDACAITTDIKNGTISGITSPAAIGSNVSFTLAPTDDTYKLDSYKVFKTGDEATTVEVTESNGTYKFTMPDYPVTVSATFVKKTHDVTTSCTPAEGGKVTIIDKTSPVTVGDSVNINVAANAHYEIEAVTVNSESVTLGEHGDYTFTMPNKDVTISATFKKKQYSVTTNGEKVKFDGLNDKYTWGDTVEFTVTPDKWYNIKSVYANDETVAITPVAGKENTYSFTMPQGDVVITAVTERPNFTVTFDSKGGSNITPKTVANGDATDKPDVPVWAVRGFAGWYTDENYTQKYDFTTPVTENITLYARWFLWGDVNNDGVTDSKDALLIRRCKVGLISYDSITNNIAGCVNGISETKSYPDSNDALAIRRFSVGLINRYAVEDSAAGYEFDLENDTYIPKN